MDRESTVQQTGLFWFRKLSQPEHESFIQNFIDYGKRIESDQPINAFSKYLNEPCDSMADFFSGAFPLAESPEGAEFWENVAQKHK